MHSDLENHKNDKQLLHNLSYHLGLGVDFGVGLLELNSGGLEELENSDLMG